MNRVLEVDDNRDLGKLTSEMLKERGFRVNITFDGESALAKINKFPYEAMVLDYKLPGISGLAVLEKALRLRPFLQTVMISAFGNESVRTKAKELGVYAFLDKPFNIDMLVRLLKKKPQKHKISTEAQRKTSAFQRLPSMPLLW